MLAKVGPSFRPVGVLALAVTATLAAQQEAGSDARASVRLEELPALARARNERLRPRMVAALAPFLNDLTMDYGGASNRAYLDRRIEEIAALGDSLVPLLLEKLRPPDTTPADLNVAANSARVLARLGPAGFIAPLMEMVRSENGIARSHAIPLLGKSGHPEAGRFLEQMLDTLPKNNQPAAVHALRLLDRRGAAPKVAELLTSAEPSLRAACVEFLAHLGSAEHRGKVLTALRGENQEFLLASYLAFLQRHAAGDGEAAGVLLTLLDPGRLLLPRQYELVRALATIAPKGHDPTIARLRAIIEGGELGYLGRACALTMLALGDQSGRKELLEGLDKAVRRSPKAALDQQNKAEALYAFEKWSDALREFREALRNARTTTVQREINVWIARCLVRQQQSRRAAQVLREANVPKTDIEAAANDDPAFKQALAEQEDLRKLLRELGR